MATERQKQERAAIEGPAPYVYRFHFECEDGETFSAIALSEAHAFRVLNAERPSIRARFDGTTTAHSGFRQRVNA